MTTMVTPTGNRITSASAHRHPEAPVITNARTATSSELASRVRRYTLAMAFRMICFLGMIVVDGWLRWVLLAVAVFMPYLAVVVANQADQRSAAPVAAVAPEPAVALTVGPVGDIIEGEIITGAVVAGDTEPLQRVA